MKGREKGYDPGVVPGRVECFEALGRLELTDIGGVGYPIMGISKGFRNS